MILKAKKPIPTGGPVKPLTAEMRRLNKDVSAVLTSQLQRVVSSITSGNGIGSVRFLNSRQEAVKVAKQVRPAWYSAFKKGGDKALTQLRRFPKKTLSQYSSQELETASTVDTKAIAKIEIPDWVEDPNVLDAIDKEIFRFALEIDQTSADMLRLTLKRGLEEGATISTLKKEIQTISDEWIEGWRSEMIARTETSRAFSTGHVEAWRSTGIVERKVWVAAGDACPFCLAMHGKTVGLEDNFFDQGEDQTISYSGRRIALGHDYSDVIGPPLHPNCRCAIVGEVEE